ncbi:helix-turn-helix domain-containing protein [Methylobacterium radiotolerans]|uniref:helix-turn-helix domain-containing protein n=1 Tax=Methylobacterium radiotolerans TaxID=31998 RepID=UPI0038D025DD
MKQAQAIAEGRTQGGWTFESLASAAGVSSRTILRAEQGVRIKPASLKRICDALGIDPKDLDAPSGDGEGFDPGDDAPSPFAERAASETPSPGAWHRACLRRLPGALAMATITTLATVAGNALFVMSATERTPAMHLAAEAAAIRAVARYANALADGASDVKPLRGFTVETCQSGASMLERIRWTLAPTCRMRTVRIESYSNSPATTLVVGPVSRGFAGHVARRLSAAPSTEWSVAMSSAPSPRGAAWFDPMQASAGQLPNPPGESEETWLFLRMRSSSNEGTIR